MLFFLLTMTALLAGAAEYPPTLTSGPWRAGHVQGVAVDQQGGFVYYSFTNLFVKADLATGRVIGTLGGFHGHLGDLAFHNGRVYGSLEYKDAKAFYIAVIDGGKINITGLQAHGNDLMLTVHLPEVASDFVSGKYGCSGIDGVSFGPRFGETAGKLYLTVAYGIFGETTRTDNDHQVLLQYDIAGWDPQPLDEANPHRQGPAKADGKYFVYTGNTKFGVQNLEYDAGSHTWLMGVYAGSKPGFPNYTLFAVDGRGKPRQTAIGLLLPVPRGWYQKADVGMVSLGSGGLFYLAENQTQDGMQSAVLKLVRWTGNGFVPVTLH
ncbi:hypothetical protein F183_A01940 [Bryobacterales bacterium F-183]|nr:hypothetical protein F183_A01940 [Bryobacterales bacterium F-183]